ncbi:MAG: hypothetical protein ACOYXU_07280 [Nitrospirota bacterium]
MFHPFVLSLSKDLHTAVRRPTSRWLWLAVVWLTLIAGCAAHRHAAERDALPKRDATLEELQQLLAERGGGGGYRALVTFEVSRGNRSGSVKGTVRFTPPRTLDIRGLDPLGRDLFALRAEGESVTLLRADGAPALESTDAIESALGPWMGSLRVSDVLRVTGSGQGPFVDPLDLLALERGEDVYTLYVLMLDDGRARLDRKIRFERTRFLPVSEEWFDPNGSSRLRVEFDRYREVAGRWRPFLVSATNGAGSLRIAFHEIAAEPS